MDADALVVVHRNNCVCACRPKPLTGQCSAGNLLLRMKSILILGIKIAAACVITYIIIFEVLELFPAPRSFAALLGV